MSHAPTALKVFLTAAAVLAFVPCGRADDKATKGKEQPLNELSLEVSALQTLHLLQATHDQLEFLRKIAKETAEEPSPRQKGKASDDFRKRLADLRDALVAGKDESKIEELGEKLDELRESEKPELDDNFDITDEARSHAAQVLKKLSPSQVAAYLGGIAPEVADPEGELINALKKVRGVDAKRWKELRESTSDVVANLVAGADADKAQEVNEKVVQLLILARSMKDDEFKAQLPDLEKKARDIAGKLDSFAVLRNFMERDLATLLSNPQLPAALQARLK